MDYQGIIDRYYPETGALRQLYMHHCRQVANRALLIARRHPELNLDTEFLEEGAMLHDIGIFRCHAPGIYCTGTEPYICHGLIGGQLLRQEGHERHARVCERHTGTGITNEQIRQRCLPMPEGHYTPETLEEQVICYADKFYSKSRPDSVLSVTEASQQLERFGPDGVKKFHEWVFMFE